CAIVKNLKFDDSRIKEVIDLQEKLHTTIGRNRKKVAIGIYPLEKINLPIIYEARKPSDIKFIPLEAEREMTGQQILQSHPTGRTYAHLLEGYEKFPVFTDSKGNIISMPPIINSHDTGKITEQTTDIFIECSGWHFETLKKTLNIIITTLAEMGGTIYAMKLQYENKETYITPDLTPDKIKISLNNVNKLLGLTLKEIDIIKLLPKMGYEYKNKTVFVPAWRVDILHEVDIIEDIAIAYGYDRLIPQIPKVATIGEETKESKITNKIAQILTGLGLLETSSYHLIKAREAELSKLKEKIEVIDSKTEYKFLRQNLLIPSLRILKENKDNEYPQKFFEIGTVFSLDKEDKTETGILESEHLIIISSPANFTEMKQIIDYLTSMLGIKYELSESSHPNLIEGRTGSIKVNNKDIGYIGELHPETLRQWGIKMPASVIEISLEEIFELLNNK
ncbi:MAG: phenylalanine--tRNA ligase subunit beta, partial [Nanoarchaeota archaeon]|nr:phenylalanine--tRNA ligase subunit beta [Nanoarchaeota archaeon]